MTTAESSNSYLLMVIYLLFDIPHATPHLLINIHSNKLMVLFTISYLPEMSLINLVNVQLSLTTCYNCGKSSNDFLNSSKFKKRFLSASAA